MSASSFATIIIDKIKSAVGTDGSKYDSSTPTKIMKAIAEGITEYILDNTKVIITYAGIIPGPPPTPDPLVSDTAKVKGKCDPLSTPGSAGTGDPEPYFNAWVKDIESKIMAGFEVDKGLGGVEPISPPVKSFQIPGLKISQADLGKAHENNLDKPQQAVWEEITKQIIAWINTITISYPAKNGNTSSTGSVSVAKMTIT